MIERNGGRLSTGFLGTPYLLHALSENGRIDVAYNLLFQEKCPSWLFQVNKGATTMWEHWDGIDENDDFWSAEMNSFNHYAYGSVFDWIFENSVGIKRIKEGLKEIEISPKIDYRFGFIKSSYKYKNKEITIEWKKEDGKYVCEVYLSKGVNAYFVEHNNRIKLSPGLTKISL